MDNNGEMSNKCNGNNSGRLNSARVLQWKYTACEYNIEEANGFYTYSKSDELTDIEKEELVDLVARYTQPDSAPLQPTVEELRRFPVSFSSFHLSSGKSVICRVCAVGRDYGGSRFGNFFAHALVLSSEDWYSPISFFDSPSFKRGLSDKEIHLGHKPSPLPTLPLETVERLQEYERIEKYDSLSAKYRQCLSLLVDRLLKATVQGRNFVVFLDDRQLVDAPKITRDLLGLLPSTFASKIAFSTYLYNPAYEPLFKKFDRNAREYSICPEYILLSFTSSTMKDRLDLSSFVYLDFSEEIHNSYNSLETEYARVLSDVFLSFVNGFDNVWKNDALLGTTLISQEQKNIERKEDFDVLNDVACLYQTTKGNIPSNLKWDRIWKLLLPLDGSKNPLPLDQAKNIVQKIFHNDFTKVSGYTEHIREIVAFGARFNFADGQVSNAKTDCLLVDFWMRHIPKNNSRLYQLWLKECYSEIERIFGTSNLIVQSNRFRTFSSVSNDNDLTIHYLHFLLARPLNTNEIIIALTMGVYALVNFPDYFQESREKNREFNLLLQKNFPPLLIDEGWRARFFEAICWDILAKKARNPKTFIVFFDLFELRLGKKVFQIDEDRFSTTKQRLLGVFFKRFFTSEALKAWKKGTTYIVDDIGMNSIALANDEPEELEENYQGLIFLDEESYQEERKQQRSQGIQAPSSSNSSFDNSKSYKHIASGAEALFIALISLEAWEIWQVFPLSEIHLLGFWKIRKHFLRLASDKEQERLKVADQKIYPDEIRRFNLVINILCITMLCVFSVLIAFIVWHFFSEDILNFFTSIKEWRPRHFHRK